MATYSTSTKTLTGLVVRQGLDVDYLTVAGSTVIAGGPTGPTGPTGAAGATGATGTTAASGSAPSTATSTGTAGTIAYDATHIYVCIATNTWVRATLATW